MFLLFADPCNARDISENSGNAEAKAATNAQLRDLVQQVRSAPGDTAASRTLENTVAAGLPNPFDTSLIPDLPVDSGELDGDLGTVVTLRAYLPSTAVEPQRETVFPHLSYVYRRAATPDQPYQVLFCCVHYTEAQDASLAERTGKLLLLARDTMVKNLKRAPFNQDRPFDVWLCRTGDAGGEQWRDNLYLYDLDRKRSSIEWIREIVHEYSHLAFPAIGGFEEPEYWANGYLGERLIVRWIERRKDGPQLVESLWGTFSGAANFNKLLIAPALKLYTQTGPSVAWINRKDADGMRYFIGQVLTMDDKYGGRALGEAMSRLPHLREAKPADLVACLAQVAPAKKSAQKQTNL